MLELPLHVNYVKYLSILYSHILKAATFQKAIFFVKINTL